MLFLFRNTFKQLKDSNKPSTAAKTEQENKSIISHFLWLKSNKYNNVAINKFIVFHSSFYEEWEGHL